MQQKLIIVGCGGFGKEVLLRALEVNALEARFSVLGYCDDNPHKKGQLISGYPVLGSPEEVDADMPDKPAFICSIGTNEVRARVVQRVLGLGWIPVSIIHPSVIIDPEVEIGLGTYIGPKAIVCPNAKVGNHVLINIDVTIGHDAIIGDFAQVSPGGRVSGASVLKEGAMMGSNAVIFQKKTIGRYATLGACSFGMRNVPDGTTALGIPARVALQNAVTGETR